MVWWPLQPQAFAGAGAQRIERVNSSSAGVLILKIMMVEIVAQGVVHGSARKASLRRGELQKSFLESV